MHRTVTSTDSEPPEPESAAPSDPVDPAHPPPTDHAPCSPLSADILPLKFSRSRPSDAPSSLTKLVGRLRFRHLFLLIALDDHRNLHRAARAVHISQPTASKTIQDMESLFHSPLFDRVPTGMEPTELGNVVLAFARRTLSELKRVAAASDHRRDQASQRLVIGASIDLSPDSIADAMAEMKRLHPGLPVKVICNSNDWILSDLIAGDIELAVGYLNDRAQPGVVDYEPLGHEHLCILARHGHPLAQTQSPPMPELHRAAWILQSHSSCARRVIDQLFRRARMSPPANIVESDSLPMTLSLLLRDDVLALLPERVASPLLQQGQVTRLPLALDDHRLEFGILTRPDESLSTAALQFRQLLRTHGLKIKASARSDS